MPETIEKLDKVLHCLERGYISIRECEDSLEEICLDESATCQSLDDRLYCYKRLKRYCWNKLLKINK